MTRTPPIRMLRYLKLVMVGAAVACVHLPATAQPTPSFAGAWVWDATRRNPLDVYGEIRLVETSNSDVRLTMVDYGAAWIRGSFRDVVRMVPWTFPFGRWAPRRGGEQSKQPLARGRLMDGGVVLAKRTVYGNGDFVWVWSLGRDGEELLHQDTDQTWDADFAARPAEGGRTYFLRASPEDSVSATSVEARVSGLIGALPVADEIVVRVGPDLRTILVSCPRQSCRIVELESGVQVGVRPLPLGTVAVIPAHTEARVEPIP